MCLSGEGVNIDIQQAEHYFSKATKTVVLANYDLAKLYEDYADDFNNVSKDYINGLYKKALEGMIEQEENDIQNAFTEMRIANMYLAGKGTDINVNSAIEWLNKAAKQDNQNAAYQLGYIYSSENTISLMNKRLTKIIKEPAWNMRKQKKKTVMLQLKADLVRCI